MELLDQYRKVWRNVRRIYEMGYCVYERGLQAAMYKELSDQFPEKNIVVEPRWKQSKVKYIPDLIIASRDEIIDIFEIKFVPWGYPVYEEDEKKLLNYKGEHYVKLDPNSGDSCAPLPIIENCRLHLVIVGKSDSSAFQPNKISNKIILWYGKISEHPNWSDWGVCAGEKYD